MSRKLKARPVPFCCRFGSGPGLLAASFRRQFAGSFYQNASLHHLIAHLHRKRAHLFPVASQNRSGFFYAGQCGSVAVDALAGITYPLIDIGF